MVRRTCRIWFTSLHHLFVVGVLFFAPTFAIGWLLDEHVDQRGVEPVMGLSTMLFALLMQGAVVSLVFQKLLGQRPRLLASIGAGMKRALSVVGVALLAGLVSMLVFFVVGLLGKGMPKPVAGILAIGAVVALVVLFVSWCVAIPAAVVEKLSALAAVRRSLRLTKGSRLRILGALLLLTVLFYAAELAIVLPVMLIARVAEFAATPWFFMALLTLVASFVSVWPTVLYHELRESKEGVGLEQLASVFQ